MGPAGLAVAADERVFRSVQIDQRNCESGFFQLAEDGRKLGEFGALPNIYNDSGLLALRPGATAQFGKLRHQFDWEIVYAEITHVLKRLEHRPFSGAAQSSNNDEWCL